MKKASMILIAAAIAITGLSGCGSVGKSTEAPDNWETLTTPVFSVQYDADNWGNLTSQSYDGISVDILTKNGTPAIENPMSFDVNEGSAIITFTYANGPFVDFEDYVESKTKLDQRAGKVSGKSHSKSSLNGTEKYGSQYTLKLNSDDLEITKIYKGVDLERGSVMAECYITNKDDVKTVKQFLSTMGNPSRASVEEENRDEQ